MKQVTYDVRAINKDGKVVITKTFKKKGKLLDFFRRAVERFRKVIVKRQVTKQKFTIVPSEDWGIRDHTAYSYAGPVDTIFIHTSVTTQLEASAKKNDEKAQMRSVDNIAFGRGFNGFSYSFGVFPSGRGYEGRGWNVVEAATAPYNEESDSISFIGNTDVFDPTEAQFEAIIAIIKDGQRRGKVTANATIRFHREVAPKACPGAKVTEAHRRRIQRGVSQ